MKTKTRKPLVIWVAQSTTGRLGRITYYYRREAAQNGRPVKFIEAKKGGGK